MALFVNAAGKVMLNASGQPIVCSTCPCSNYPQPDPSICNECTTDAPTYLQLNTNALTEDGIDDLLGDDADCLALLEDSDYQLLAAVDYPSPWTLGCFYYTMLSAFGACDPQNGPWDSIMVWASFNSGTVASGAFFINDNVNEESLLTDVANGVNEIVMLSHTKSIGTPGDCVGPHTLEYNNGFGGLSNATLTGVP